MKRAPSALIVASIVWGLSVPIATAALHQLTAADLVLAENLSGTAFVAGAALVTRRRVRGPWRPAIALGTLEPGLAYVLIGLGLQRTTAVAGSMLLSLESVFIALLGWLLLRERLRGMESVALALGFGGALLVALAEPGGAGSLSGDALVVLGSLAAAAFAIVARRVPADIDPLGLVFRQGVAASVVTLPFVIWSFLSQGSRLGSVGAPVLGLAILEGLVGFAIPFTLWAYAAPHVRTGVAAVAINLVPVVGVLTASVVGLGRPTALQALGGVVILAGVALLSMRAQNTSQPAVDEAAGTLAAQSCENLASLP